MNILYLINELQLGGSQLGAIKEIQSLSERGHRVTVVARDGKIRDKFEDISYKVDIVTLPIFGLPKQMKLKKDKIKNTAINTLRSIRRLRLPRAILKVKNIVNRDNIDVIYSCQPGPSQVAHIVSLITKTPFVVRVQHVLSNEFPMMFHKTVISDTYAVSVITNEIKSYLIEEYDLEESKIEIIPTCIELDKYIDAKRIKYENLKKDLGIKEEDLVIVSIATHREDKMKPVISLIEAVDKLNEINQSIKCILVGDGTYQQEVCDIANTINNKYVEKIIIPVGRQMDLNPYLSIADLGVGVGRCAMELLASGNALICASHQGFGGLFTKNIAIDISKYNFSGRNTMEASSEVNIYNSINMYLEMDEKERKELGLFGMKFIHENYSIDKIMDDTEQILIDAIKNNCKEKDTNVN